MKKANVWYVAIVYWLIAWLFSIVVGTIVLGGLAIALSSIIISHPIIVEILAYIGLPLLLWLGIFCSARFINKRYIIDDPKKIVNISTLIYIVIPGLSGASSRYSHGTTANLISAVVDFITLAIFYFGSKKYIKKNAS